MNECESTCMKVCVCVCALVLKDCLSTCCADMRVPSYPLRRCAPPGHQVWNCGKGYLSHQRRREVGGKWYFSHGARVGHDWKIVEKIAPLKQSTACHPWSKMVKNITETCACLPHSTRSSKTSAISVKTQRAESTSEPLWLDRKRHKMRLVALSRTTSGCSHNGKAHVTGDHPWIHDQETSKRKSSDSEAFKLYRFFYLPTGISVV